MAIAFNFRDVPGQSITPAEREHLEAQLLATNDKISRHLAWITLSLTPLLILIDIQRWHKGLFDTSVLYLALAALHAALALSAAPGIVLWFRNHASHAKRAIAAKAHLFMVTSSLAGMGILGILERGGLIFVAIALICTNLVYQISFRQRLLFNLGLSVSTALTLYAFSGDDVLKTLIVTGEALGLVLICAVAGELRFRDFTALILAEKKMARMARSDALTGVANRRSLEEHLGSHPSAVARGRPLTVIMIDIDHFKSVNDTYGHDVGDAVLKAVAQLLLDGVRPFDLVGRWGGEEFLVICPDTQCDPGRLVAERLAALLRSTEIDQVGRRTASFGVAQARPSDTIDSLFIKADQALYAAKSGGRDRVCVAA
jgi:diguanylate cyclase (GGDEF)-like protein